MIKVSKNGITHSYKSSRLSAIKTARQLSVELAKAWPGRNPAAEVHTGHHLITFRNGKRIKTQKIGLNDRYYY